MIALGCFIAVIAIIIGFALRESWRLTLEIRENAERNGDVTMYGYPHSKPAKKKKAKPAPKPKPKKGE